MDEHIRKELREHAWKYFVVHADQRMKAFNFYLVVAALVTGAAVTIAKDGENVEAASILALLLPFLSFVFYKLDVRTKRLIHHAEDAIKLTEGDSGLEDVKGAPHPLKLFLHEEHITETQKTQPVGYWWERPWSYSTCFNIVFAAFGLAGLLTALFFLMRSTCS
jgi:hypothetical protein